MHFQCFCAKKLKMCIHPSKGNWKESATGTKRETGAPNLSIRGSLYQKLWTHLDKREKRTLRSTNEFLTWLVFKTDHASWIGLDYTFRYISFPCWLGLILFIFCLFVFIVEKVGRNKRHMAISWTIWQWKQTVDDACFNPWKLDLFFTLLSG